MRALGTLLMVCVAFAVVKAAMAALLLVLAIALIWGVCLHPREVFGFMAYCTIMGAISARPTLAISMIGLAILVGQIANNAPKPS